MSMTPFAIASARRFLCCPDFPGHNFTTTWGITVSPLLSLNIPKHYLDCCRTGTSTDHRSEIRAAFVFGPVRIIDSIVDRYIHRLERDFARHAGRCDPACLLP